MSAPAALAVALAVTALATPAAARLARRLSFFDVPAGYKQHGAPTPYLGGLAVLVGLLAGAAAGGVARGQLPIVLAALAAWAVGTLDDRRGLGAGERVAFEAAVGVALWGAGVGWAIPGAALVDLPLTVAWVVLVVNAFNLMDNLDGACATSAAVAGLGLGGLALLDGSTAPAVLAFAGAGAALGFLPSNLRRPARIFLGDGGSMLLGMLVAAVAMRGAPTHALGLGGVLAAALVVGLPLFDTTLVVLSRRRRGLPVLTGGRDHLTHRLLARCGSPRGVCARLALGAASLSALALAWSELGKEALLWGATGTVAIALCALAALERLDKPAARPVALRSTP